MLSVVAVTLEVIACAPLQSQVSTLAINCSHMLPTLCLSNGSCFASHVAPAAGGQGSRSLRKAVLERKQVLQVVVAEEYLGTRAVS